jgi:type II secretion system protein H
MTTSDHYPAFSLIELIVVLVIVGVLAAVAIPRFAGSAVRQRVDAAARRVAADLNLARRHAYHASASQSVGFDVSANSYRLAGLPDPDHPAVDYEVCLSDQPYQAQLVSADFSGFEKVTFDAFGAPNNGGAVVVAVGDQKRIVVVDPDTGEAYLP